MCKIFSIVIPIYKNELNLPITISKIIEQIPILFSTWRVEIILVNDGSPDNSWEIMKEYQGKYPESIKIARFTRNFGQTAAIYYGLSIAKGDVIGIISADLQDPFDLFPTMLKKWEEGYQLVCAVRKKRMEKGVNVCISKLTHKLIQKFINDQYPEGGYDFYLMDASVSHALLETREKNGQPQISLLWLGVPTYFISYTRNKREIGKSGWTLAKKVKLFIDIFTTYTYLPLRVMSFVGCLCALCAFLYGAYLFIIALVETAIVPGWSALAVMITFFSGMILFSLGIIGEYLWRIFDEVKQRPMYIVRENQGNQIQAKSQFEGK